MSYFSIDQGNFLAEVQDERDKLRKENKELKDKLAEAKKLVEKWRQKSFVLTFNPLKCADELEKIVGVY